MPGYTLHIPAHYHVYKYSPIHISPRIIFMYISTHLYIYLHASYSHIHVTKPRTCNNTTNMYQCCRYVTILRIHIYIDVTIIQYITLPPCLTSSDEFVYLNTHIIPNSNETSIYIHNVLWYIFKCFIHILFIPAIACVKSCNYLWRLNFSIFFGASTLRVIPTHTIRIDKILILSSTSTNAVV